MKTIEMTLEEAMKHCFNDAPFENEKRKWFNNKEAAETYSESLKALWADGLGQIYGPFVDAKNKTWYEVSYK